VTSHALDAPPTSCDRPAPWSRPAGMLAGMGLIDGADLSPLDPAQAAAVCSAVLRCCDRILNTEAGGGPGADAAVPDALADALADAVADARALAGLRPGVGPALDLVGRGASGATPATLRAAVEVLRAVAAPVPLVRESGLPPRRVADP
jgi:hypothetical protein